MYKYIMNIILFIIIKFIYVYYFMIIIIYYINYFVYLFHILQMLLLHFKTSFA